MSVYAKSQCDTSKEQILQKLWDGSGNGNYVDSNTLTVYIRRLRIKIEDNPPIAALSIYNEMLQGETEDLPVIKRFTMLSEQELNRIETLVQNLLEIELHFAYRVKQEKKEIVLSGADNITLYCDRDWMIEAISNVVKNALDHTRAGDRIVIEWKGLPDQIQIIVKDNGCGIHPEDIYYIFKRFYRSRFSKDTQGIGLGLPLTKAIVEAHDGNIAVDSELGRGSVFYITFFKS